ncbi:hypothetical protein BD779DRAFT_1471625 [Infundibulicybe gibba]|nr:hypothetical protein BD779DRAFT_1471625 [Infundibulicybe gibba]
MHSTIEYSVLLNVSPTPKLLMDEKTDRRSIKKVSDERVRTDGGSVGELRYMNVVPAALHPDAQTTALKTQLSDSALVGEVVGMILFGLYIDRWRRKLGMFANTILLVFGIILATAAHGKNPTGMLWMTVISRGIVGVGADSIQKRRGVLVGSATMVSLASGFISSSIVSVIVIAAYGDTQSVTSTISRFGLLPNDIEGRSLAVQAPGSGTFTLLAPTIAIGRHWTFALGFSLIEVFAFIIGGTMVPLCARFPTFVVLYGLFQTFFKLAPGPGVYWLPLMGRFSVATGKIGAAVFPAIVASYPAEIKAQQVIFLIGAGIAVFSIVMLWALIQDRERQLESEDALFKAYLEGK